MQQLKNTVITATNFLQRELTHKAIDTVVVLGSGLSGLSMQGLVEVERIPYSRIPGMPESTAPSHAGELRIYQSKAGSGVAKNIAVCAGRHHLYEGYSPQQVCTLLYTLSQFGATELITTNAAGALNPAFHPGDVMLINDHINFTGQNPLIGQDDSFGMRFPDMSEAYNKRLLNKAIEVAKTHKLNHHQGVYAGVTGPNLETSAERRMFRTLGADAVGMSTVMEVIAANHCSMNVLGLSAITNLALGGADQQPDTIDTVLENAAIAGVSINKIIQTLLS